MYIYSGSPRLSGFVAITILVADENDNTPEFEHAHYRGKVQENAATPAYVTTVTAVDQDTENNGKITYVVVYMLTYDCKSMYTSCDP